MFTTNRINTVHFHSENNYFDYYEQLKIITKNVSVKIVDHLKKDENWSRVPNPAPQGPLLFLSYPCSTHCWLSGWCLSRHHLRRSGRRQSELVSRSYWLTEHTWQRWKTVRAVGLEDQSGEPMIYLLEKDSIVNHSDNDIMYHYILIKNGELWMWTSRHQYNIWALTWYVIFGPRVGWNSLKNIHSIRVVIVDISVRETKVQMLN